MKVWVFMLAVLATCVLLLAGCDRKEATSGWGSASNPSSPAAGAGRGGGGGGVAKPPALAGTVSLSGSSTVAPLAAELGKVFEARHPGVRVNVEMGGSSRGIVDARSGQVDVGMVSRALKAEEQDLTPYLIARDGIAMIVNADVHVEQLSREQIIGIYTGTITDWNQVGADTHPITVVNKAEGRSTLELFLHHFGLKAPDIKASVVIGDNQQGIKSVASIPGAVGYVSVGAAEAAIHEGTAIRLLPLGGVAATTENVRNGSFPLSRELNLVTKGTPTAAAREFIEFCRSSDADATIRELYFVPIR